MSKESEGGQESPNAALPLRGIRVLDAATLLAGPLAASLLGDLGAEVIKVEHPKTGDPLRGYPPFKDGVSLIHKVTNRNKRAITLDLSQGEGQDYFRRLAEQVDVVVLNFRPATLEKWGLSYENLSRSNPGLIFLHVSAFGNTGPYRDRPGFARIAEAFTGLAHITGYADREPVLAGYPVIDAVTGLFGSFSITSALHGRASTGMGSFIDLGLYEPMLRLMEDLVVSVEFGVERSRGGNRNPFVAPNDLYECSDGHFLVLPISTDRMFERLSRIMQRTDLFQAYPTNAQRVEHRAEIDVAVKDFLKTVTAQDAVDWLSKEEIPAGRIYSPTDIVNDAHIAERGNLIQIYDEECQTDLTMQAPLPIGSGRVDFAGRPLGFDNSSIYANLLGLTPEQLTDLADRGVI